MTLAWEHEHVPAILNAWFGGTEAAVAIADVLFGDVNPSGKLPATFSQHVGQVPLYYAAKNTGRPLAEGQWFQKFRSNYLDVSNDPLYPFGYGLSYTQFEYDEPRLSKQSITVDETLEVRVRVTNTGDYEGDEVVQLYIRDLVGTVTRPVKELKGFKRIGLKPGESQEVVFHISEEDLKFYNAKLDYVAEPGAFDVFVGPNSRDVMALRFELTD